MSLPKMGCYARSTIKYISCMKIRCLKTEIYNVRFVSKTPSQSAKDSTAGLEDTSYKVGGNTNAEELLKNSVTNMHEKLNEKNMWSSPAYPKCEQLARDQSRKRVQPNVNPEETSIILFPGQGSQYVGMGKSLANFPEFKLICDVASDFLGYDLLELCSSGPAEKLNRTEHSQMAVFVLSYAATELLKIEQPGLIEKCIATAGFSIGEITALVFSGAISFSEALSLVKVRAQAMQEACDAAPGGMMTVFYGPDSRLEYACLCAREWCAERGIENPVCKIANYLFPHCKVIAGHVEALKFVEQNASKFKLKRLKKIAVSGAFHTELMKPAAEPFKKALREIDIKHPKIPVYSNVNGNRYRNVRHIIELLPKQIYSPVKWEQTLHVLYERTSEERYPVTYECGPGTNLKSGLKLVNTKAWNNCFNVKV